jgi:hypothetical protein
LKDAFIHAGTNGESGMQSEEAERRQREFHELSGALMAINALQERLELRLNEARDECVRETLDNVIALVRAHGFEYQQRRSALQTTLDLELTR